MKKLMVILLTFILISAFSIGALATSQTTLNFNLTCDGQNEISKSTGDIITVTFTLENVTDEAAGYGISSLTNEIYYDHNFFEFVEGSAEVETGLNLSTRLAIYSSGEHRVYFNGFEIPTKEYEAKQVIGTFQLKVIATEGSSTIHSIGMIASGEGSYKITSADLAVKIGDAPVTPLYELSFETNGGDPILAVKKDEGTVIDLKEYIPTKDGYDFEGWYSDEGLTEAVESVKLENSITVYAKWSLKQDPPSDTDVNDPPASSPDTEWTPPEDNSDDYWSWLIWILVALIILIIIIIL